MSYGFSNDKVYEISADKILQLKPDSLLWRFYLGQDYELGRSIRAPYRDDHDPSFCLTYNLKSGKILGKDHGKGKFHGDVFDYIMMVYRLDYYSSMVKVNLDFDLGLNYSAQKCSMGTTRVERYDPSLDTFVIKHQSERLLQYLRRDADQTDLDYWATYGISRQTLQRYRVCAVQKVFLEHSQYYAHKEEDRCYAYWFPRTEYRSKESLKCYWPWRTKHRFLGNASNDMGVQGYDQCSIARHEKGHLLVITKSLKDCMVLHEFGIDAIAAHGESHKFSVDFMRHLYKYYDRIVSIYDRDATGVKGARYLWKEYKVCPYLINKKYKCKDISDLYKAHGYQITKQFITTIEDYGNTTENNGRIDPKE